jgi:hypothetical protein
MNQQINQKNTWEEESEAPEHVAVTVAAAGPQKWGPNWLRYNSKRFPNAGEGKGGIRRRERLAGINQPVFHEMRKLQRST